MRNLILSAMLFLTLAASSAARNGSNFGIFSDYSEGGSSYLGVDTRDITPDRLGALHLKEERGVEITMVDQDAPAGKAGLKEHDVILTLNGEKIESVEQLRRMIRETPSGRVVSLGISRNGTPMTVKVPLSDRKDNFSYEFPHKMKDYHFEMPAMPAMPDIDIPVSVVVVNSSMRSGLMVENMTAQLGDYFGAKNGQGVLVRSVEKGSRADKAGFHAGDVIVKINGEAIHDSSDFSYALRNRKDNSAQVTVLRDKKEQNLTLVLPDRKQSHSIWESLNLSDLDTDAEIDMADLQSEIAELRPEMERTVRAEMEKIRPELEKQRQELFKQKAAIKKQSAEIQRQWRERQMEIERELRREFGHTADF